jgi:hypothetical protein
MFVQSTEFDLHYTTSIDRFLLYLVPVIVIAALCAVTDPRPLRWSLAAAGRSSRSGSAPAPCRG